MRLTYRTHNHEHIRKKIIEYLWERTAKYERDVSFKSKQIPVSCNPSLTTRILKEHYVGNVIKQLNHPNGTHPTIFKTQFWTRSE